MSNPEATARIRARCAMATPRIRYRELAEETGYSEAYVKALCNDVHALPEETHQTLVDGLDRIEARRKAGVAS